MGMRVVGLGQEVIDINAELGVLRKSAVVGGKIFDKCMILDRKHRIKDRLISGFHWAYDQVTRTASQVQSDIKQDRSTGDGADAGDGKDREGVREQQRGSERGEEVSREQQQR